MGVWKTEFQLKVSQWKVVSAYDQEIPQSQMQKTPRHCKEEPPNHHETPGRQTKQSNQPPLPIKMTEIPEQHRTTTEVCNNISANVISLNKILSFARLSRNIERQKVQFIVVKKENKRNEARNCL